MKKLFTLALALGLFYNSHSFDPSSYVKIFANFCLDHYFINNSDFEKDLALFDKTLYCQEVCISVKDKNSNRVFDSSDVLTICYEKDSVGLRLDYSSGKTTFFGKYLIKGHEIVQVFDNEKDDGELRGFFSKVGWFILPYRTIKGKQFRDTSNLDVVVNKNLNNAVIEQVGRAVLMPGKHSDPDYNSRLIFQIKKEFKKKYGVEINGFVGSIYLDIESDVVSSIKTVEN